MCWRHWNLVRLHENSNFIFFLCLDRFYVNVLPISLLLPIIRQMGCIMIIGKDANNFGVPIWLSPAVGPKWPIRCCLSNILNTGEPSWWPLQHMCEPGGAGPAERGLGNCDNPTDKSYWDGPLLLHCPLQLVPGPVEQEGQGFGAKPGTNARESIESTFISICWTGQSLSWFQFARQSYRYLGGQCLGISFQSLTAWT